MQIKGQGTQNTNVVLTLRKWFVTQMMTYGMT